VTSQWVVESARDIGIRRAIGASAPQIVTWFTHRLAWVVIPGSAAGLLLVAGAFRLLVANIEGISAPSVTQLLMVGGVTLALVLAAAALPLRRALITDAKTLMQEHAAA
jgi:ABC-type antimicrobial peptide transport system permease subunit